MAMETTTTDAMSQWLVRLHAGEPGARDRLIDCASERLDRLTRRMLDDFPRAGRREQAGDARREAMSRLDRAMEQGPPASVLDFLRLGAYQIRRELIDLARRYCGIRARAPTSTAPSISRRTVRLTTARCSTRPRRPASRRDGPPGPSSTSRSRPSRTRSSEAFDLLWYQGLTQAESAAVLGVDERTVQRRWQAARVRIYQRMEGRTRVVTAVFQEIPTMEQNPTDNRVDELLVRWKELQKQGRTLSPEELAGDAPELAGELRTGSRRCGPGTRLSLPQRAATIGPPTFRRPGSRTSADSLPGWRLHGGLPPGRAPVPRPRRPGRGAGRSAARARSARGAEAHSPWTDPGGLTPAVSPRGRDHRPAPAPGYRPDPRSGRGRGRAVLHHALHPRGDAPGGDRAVPSGRGAASRRWPARAWSRGVWSSDSSPSARRLPTPTTRGWCTAI